MIKDMPLPQAPSEDSFAGKVLDIIFMAPASQAGYLREQLKHGTGVIVTFAQYAVPPNDTVVLGGQVRGYILRAGRKLLRHRREQSRY